MKQIGLLLHSNIMGVCFETMIDSQTGFYTETEYKAKNSCSVTKIDLISISFFSKSLLDLWQHLRSNYWRLFEQTIKKLNKNSIKDELILWLCALGINETNARSKVSDKSEGFLIFFIETPKLKFFYAFFSEQSLTCS